MKTAVILGTRPEIIKMSPVIRELEKRNKDYFILHTGQHYSYNLDKIFFEQLNLPKPKYNLEVGSGSHAEQTGKILIGVEKVLLTESPNVILVQGDTNSVLAGALAATKLHIKIGHIEAGLRSYDRQMPEEINRILTDHCADYLFAPTEKAKAALLGEGIAEERVFVTGNTIVDAIYQNLEIAMVHGNGYHELELKPKDYFLLTLHREENVDNPSRLTAIIQILDEIASSFHSTIVFPIHPRTQKRMLEYNLKPKNLVIINPLDFLGFLQLENNARLILTDSGGVQEESCILGVPCVTLRDNTERPETLDAGANILAGSYPERIYNCVETMLARTVGWQNPFGDGKASERIINIIECRKTEDK